MAHLGYMLSLPNKLWAELNGLSEAQSRKGEESAGRTRVVLIRNRLVMTNEGPLNSSIADEMLTNAMLRLTGKSTPDQSWGSLFKPEDVVGIKVNALGGKRIATHPGVVEAVVAGLKRAGVPENNIIVWDRLTDELQKAGYGINRSGRGVGCYGTDKSYDPNPEMSGSIGSLRFKR